MEHRWTSLVPSLHMPLIISVHRAVYYRQLNCKFVKDSRDEAFFFLIEAIHLRGQVLQHIFVYQYIKFKVPPLCHLVVGP